MRPMLHVLFVGKNNAIRSVLAEAILHKKIVKAALVKQFTCSSTGTDALANAPAPKDIQVFAKRQGYDLAGKRSTMVTKQSIESADIVFTLDEETLHYLHKKYALFKKKIFALKQFDISEEVRYVNILEPENPHDAAEILELYGELKKEIVRIFKKLSDISFKKVKMAEEYNKKHHIN
jgi:protein-tyrosine-phosphatase